MEEDFALRRRAVLPIGTVMSLTTLTARQIRYYENQGLVHPQRNAGNHRMYSLIDVDNLIQIVRDREAGLSLADIKRLRLARTKHQRETDSDARQVLQDELMNSSPFRQGNTIFGQGLRP
ncbi:MerR family transcriptional regulator [Lacticaseibacillus pabuli]|uniref:MerR family transcriptional regulator n=1 Tax=Lacticaseibacillus pabuli TaxID=3025672 RepID=A0ABY7X0B0_9LACO|nr:MerR family transcriptional regulator [Lacticaseibacillus sp. KACC 23028]WDF83590.1 MerR family transcriptional regulator [Lacticaseibacillus sp. KACC 23028]